MKKRNLVILLTALLIVVIVFSFCACDLFPSSSGTSKYVKPKNNTENKREEQTENTVTSTLNEYFPAEEQEDFLRLLHNNYEISTNLIESFPSHPRLIALPGYISYLSACCNGDWLLLAYFNTPGNARNAADDFNDNKYDGWETATAFSVGNKIICTVQPNLTSIPVLTNQSSVTTLEKKIRNDFFDLLEYYLDCYLDCFFEAGDSLFSEYYWLHCSKEMIQDQNKDFNIDVLYFLNSEESSSYYDFATANYSPESKYELIRKGNTVYHIDNEENAKVLLGIT